jgi:hypothetical protein
MIGIYIYAEKPLPIKAFGRWRIQGGSKKKGIEFELVE